jgi:hypothetical protein
MPSFSRLKYVYSEIGLVIQESYKEGGHETQREETKKGNPVLANGRK